MRVTPIVIVIMLNGCGFALAQQPAARDTVFKGATIEIIQSYKPQVKQLPKPEWLPQLPPVDTMRAAFKYEVPQQTLYYTYGSLPLRPLALAMDANALPFQNYLKVGGGNLSTAFIDAGIGSLRGKDYETQIHVRHMSQKGPLQYQQTSLSGLNLEGTKHKGRNDFQAAIGAERNRFGYYGRSYTAYPSADSVKQVYTALRLSAGILGRADSTHRLSYHPTVNATIYDARFNTSETSFGFNAPLTYRIDSSIDAQVSVSGTLTSYKTEGASTSNNLIMARPGLMLHGTGLHGHAFAGFALGKDGKGYILPDIVGAYNIPKTGLRLSAGWTSTLRRNTYEELTTENPYLASLYEVRQTRKTELFAAVESNRSDHLSFMAKVGWVGMKNMATFLNDSGDQRKFYVPYIDVNAVAVHLAVGYHVADAWAASVSGDLYNFYGNTEQFVYVWHEPTMKIQADLMARPVPRLMVKAYLAVLGGIYARDINHNVVKQAFIADVGAGGEYQVVPRLSVFLQLSNLLNQRYYRWYGYESYGLNAYGGLRFKF